MTLLTNFSTNEDFFSLSFGGKAPLVDVGIRWILTVSITLWSLYFRAVLYIVADSHWPGRVAGLNEVMGKTLVPFGCRTSVVHCVGSVVSVFL